MHNAVADSVDFVVARNAAVNGVGEFVKNSFYGLLMVDKSKFVGSLGAVGFLEFEESAGKADFFNTAFGKCITFFAFEVDKFIFYRAAARIENEYFHVFRGF